VAKLALVAGPAQKSLSKQITKKASGMVKVRSRSHKESVSSYHVSIILIIDHIFIWKKRKRGRKLPKKRGNFALYAYIIILAEVSACA
jgi:hypothetical protein